MIMFAPSARNDAGAARFSRAAHPALPARCGQFARPSVFCSHFKAACGPPASLPRGFGVGGRFEALTHYFCDCSASATRIFDDPHDDHDETCEFDAGLTLEIGS
jgi:hypothetical protein